MQISALLAAEESLVNQPQVRSEYDIDSSDRTPVINGSLTDSRYAAAAALLLLLRYFCCCCVTSAAVLLQLLLRCCVT